MFSVEVRELPAMTVHGLPHLGPYTAIGPTFRKLGLRLEAAGLVDRAWPWVGVYHDDPARVAARELRSHACCVLPDGAAVPWGFECVKLAGGRCAVLRYRGPYSGLAAAWGWLFGDWLPGHKAMPRGPTFEIYRSMFPTVAAEEQVTEICVPLV
ncbi:Transcriptional regulator, AraC family [Rhodovulum sp. P5]|uniref:AraC family transcriptional regulator n=1 Tax=Rhodovulum sp. P5 TaxID=1564506 RepID=UPI0009C24C29|nr:GyrI-like domain-containing protein [Rhodovulum sp. P5]ARE41283.1 Transcriptional regulator, AraC family [Rhodovulum sp. P5]